MAEADANPEDKIKELLMNELKEVFIKENIIFDKYLEELNQKRFDIVDQKELEYSKLAIEESKLSTNKDIKNSLFLNILKLIRQNKVIIKDLLNFYKRFEKEYIIIINDYKQKNIYETENIINVVEVEIEFLELINNSNIDIKELKNKLKKEEENIHMRYIEYNISKNIIEDLKKNIRLILNDEFQEKVSNFKNEISKLEKEDNKELNDKISKYKIDIERLEKEKKNLLELKTNKNNLLKLYSELLLIKKNKLKKFNQFIDMFDIVINKINLLLKDLFNKKKIHMAQYNEILLFISDNISDNISEEYDILKIKEELIKDIQKEIKDIQKEINKLKPDNILDIYNYHDKSIFMNILHTKRKEYINNMRRLKEKFKK
jgi:hypothetical protein